MFAGMRIHVPTDGDHTAAFGLAIKLKPKNAVKLTVQAQITRYVTPRCWRDWYCCQCTCLLAGHMQLYCAICA